VFRRGTERAKSAATVVRPRSRIQGLCAGVYVCVIGCLAVRDTLCFRVAWVWWNLRERMGRTALAVTVVGVPLVVLVVGNAWAWPFTIDDAYIVASYARQLGALGRYSLDGTHISDGVTGPLWIVPFVVAPYVAVEPVTFAKVVGGVCGASAVGLVLWRLRQRARGRCLALAAGALCAVQSDLAIWPIGGLETGLTTLLLVGAALAATSPQPRGVHQVTLGGCVGALAWLRPELAPAAAILLACAWSRAGRGSAMALGLAVLGVAGVFAFRLSMFGHWLPLSVFAKPAELGHGAHYAVSGVVLTTGVVGCVPFGLGMLRGRSGERWIGAVVTVHVIAVVLAGGDWMPGYRLLAPVLPLYAWVAAVGAVGRPRLRRRWQGVVLVALSCVVPFASLLVQLPRAHASGADRERRGEELARWLATHACRVALVDVGYVVYAAGIKAFDLAGVTDEGVGRLRGGHVEKRVTDELLLEREVDTLVLRAREATSIRAGLSRRLRWLSKTEQRLAHSRDVLARYRPVRVFPYADHYVYYVLQTERPQLCPRR